MAIDLVNVAAGAGGFVIHGQDANDVAGRSVSSAGDVNGDGFDDVIIGAPSADGPGNTPPGPATAMWCSARPPASRRRLTSPRSQRQWRLRHPWRRMRAIRPAFRSPRPATSTATASMTFSSGLLAPTAPATHATMPATAMWCSARPADLRRDDRSGRRRRRQRRLRHPRARTRAICPAFRSPRPATSTATASTT